nr:uncharacterized protein I203_04466 [Kwoniella mangroviensis CBS 8507]OCF66140.1 hypothetical protein I203_04466 [Kwoniella mangroviensis CBS 8507]
MAESSLVASYMPRPSMKSCRAGAKSAAQRYSTSPVWHPTPQPKCVLNLARAKQNDLKKRDMIREDRMPSGYSIHVKVDIDKIPLRYSQNAPQAVSISYPTTLLLPQDDAKF